VQLKAIAAAAAMAALLSRESASAHPYETFIDVDDEEDLYDLQATGQIDDDTLESLVELMQAGVDLNRAGREELYSLPNLTYGDVDAILEYRAAAGRIRDPIDLIVAGALAQDKLEAIASFLVIRDSSRPLFATSGWVRGQTRWSVEDDDAPPTALRARATTLRDLTVGFAGTMSRNRLADVEYLEDEEGSNALSAVAAEERLHVPKFYARWETDRWGVIAGTYRIGFGQRLTFDNTSLYTPNGFVQDDELSRETELQRACRESICADRDDEYETPDYRWRDGLLGAALGLKRLDAGPGWFQTYAFASYRPHSIYQYEIFDAGACDDPHDTADTCRAPAVYHRPVDQGGEPSEFRFSTLPDLYTEMVAGGNLAYAIDRRSRIGVTGYGADVSWRPAGIDLDFQEYSRLPYGGRFGAIGVDAAVGFGRFDLFAEVARSFDSMPDGEKGGYGAVLRSVAELAQRSELEASLRFYDENFKNPYARPIAAPDEVDGARARDEMGARLRYTARIAERLHLRGTADVWSRTSSGGGTDILVDAQSDLDLTSQLRIGLWGRYDQCLNFSLDDEAADPSDPCEGERYRVTGRFRYAPTSRYSVAAQYQQKFLVDEDRQDMTATLIGAARPVDWLRVRGRARYLSEDIGDDTSLEESVWSYLDAGFRVRPRDWLRIRYDMVVYLDDRDSTAERVPSPEHWLWFEYESRF